MATARIAPRASAWRTAPAATPTATSAATALERADGRCALTVARGTDGRTALRDLYQATPCRVLMPSVEIDDAFTAVLVTTSGGLAGGDCIDISIRAEEGAQLVVTSQAAEKIYRSTGPDTSVSVSLTARANAWLEWIPQGAILFDGSRLNRRNVIDAAASARVLASEIVVFGRTARGETVRSGFLHDAWRVYRDDKLIWADALRLDGDIPELLAHAAGFDGALAAATLLYVADDASARIDLARELLAELRGRAGATVVNGVLVMRMLNRDAQALMGDVAAFWTGFRARVAGLPATMPRVWQC
jgi:urease accessory protein